MAMTVPEQRRISEACAGAAPATYRYGRYSDRPLDWRTRFVGLSGTLAVSLSIALSLIITWRVVHPMVEQRPLTVVNMQSVEAPPEPVREVPEGPDQVQQEERKPAKRDLPDPLPEIVAPRQSTTAPPAAEKAEAVDPVRETTAPKSLPAPPSNRVSSNAEATWQALLLAHLEKHRRYPARARAARKQGVVYVTFRMNRAGMLLSSSIQRGSGSYDLDQAALDTLRRAQPLPRIPDDRPDIVELTLPVEFFTR